MLKVTGTGTFAGAVSGLIESETWEYCEERSSLVSEDGMVEVFLRPADPSDDGECRVIMDGEYFAVLSSYGVDGRSVSIV